jgi:AAA domain
MAQRRIIIVIGASGSGKTHTVAQLINDLNHVAIFDIVKDEKYADNKRVTIVNGNPKEFARAIGAVPSLTGPLEFTEESKKIKFKVVYHPVIVKPVENNSVGLVDCPEFEPIVKVCHVRGDMYLVVDEAHLLTNSWNCPPELMMVNLIGRHKEMSLILVTQSFTGVHPAIRKNADEFYFWKTIEPSELDGIKDRCGKDVMEKVKALRAVEVDKDNNFVAPGQRLHWSKFRGVEEVTE